MITLGTGIGGGMVLDGRLRRGSHGVAGEWGHMRVVPDGRLCACGNRGCWEQYASGTALAQTAREVARTSRAAAGRLLERVDGDADRLTGEDVARAAAEGDPLALELVTDVGVWLGQGIADLAAILDPEVVVIGGGVSMLGEMVLAPARDRLERALPGRGFRPGPRIVVAELGPQAGLVGAADLVRPIVVRASVRAHRATDASLAGRARAASCSRNRPMSVMMPIAWALPRSASLVTVAGLMSTRHQRDRRGQEVPGRDRVQHRRHHDREADVRQLGAHRPLALDHVGVDVGQRAVVADGAHQHERLAGLHHRVHDAAGEDAGLHGRGDRAGRADGVDRAEVVLVPVRHARPLGQGDAQGGAEQRGSMSWVASALPAKRTST